MPAGFVKRKPMRKGTADYLQLIAISAPFEFLYIISSTVLPQCVSSLQIKMNNVLAAIDILNTPDHYSSNHECTLKTGITRETFSKLTQ